MGKENGESGNTEMEALKESIFGFDKEEETSSDAEKKEETSVGDEKKEESEKKEETPKAPVTKTTAVTDEQLSINEEITKIDVEIELLEKETVDVSTFYAKLDEHMSEDEQALEFSDKAAYMRLVNDKLKEFEGANSKSEKIQTLKGKKKEKELVYERQSAIVTVSAKYPEYDHSKISDYFTNDLSKVEQEKIIDSSKSYADVFEQAYKKYLEINPTNIEKSKSPNIPDVNNIRKETPNNTDITESIQSDDEKLQQAIGFK